MTKLLQSDCGEAEAYIYFINCFGLLLIALDKMEFFISTK